MTNIDQTNRFYRPLFWTALLAVVLLSSLGLSRPSAAATSATASFIATHDTYVEAFDPAANHNGDILYAGTGLNTLAKFDISSLPSGVTINSATLYLFVADITGDLTPATPKSFDTARIDAPWNPATVNWASNPPSTGSAAPTSVNGMGDFGWDVTSMVQDWYGGTQPNHGVKVLGVSGGSYSIVARSLETVIAGQPAPRLVIDYDDDQGDPARPDLGDAPDSSNHHGIANSAYPGVGVNGFFPTVWDSPISGPKHHDARPAFLGDGFSAENEADLGPDADGLNNILDGVADNANNDDFDDGWLNPNVPIVDCQRSTLRVRVRKHPTLPTPDIMALNVWFDGNRDGDWEDVKQCQGPQGVMQPGFEWIVQDFAVNMAAIPAGGFVDINVPTVRVLNDTPNAAHWMRFTLSDKKAKDVMPVGIIPDGRGLQHPSMFELGETEDYIHIPTQGQPGNFDISKFIGSGVFNYVPGDTFVYSVRLWHAGGTAPGALTMTDMLPAGVTLAGMPTVVEETPNVAPLFATVAGNTVTWNGAMSPNSQVRIDIPVQVTPCFLRAPRTITNKAEAVTPAGIMTADVDITVNCNGAIVLDDLLVHAELFDFMPDMGRMIGAPLGFGRKGISINFNNFNPDPIKFRMKILSADDPAPEEDPHYWGCLTCTRGTTGGFIVNTVPSTNPNETIVEVELDANTEVTLDAVYGLTGDMDDDRDFPFDISICIPDVDTGLCPLLNDAVPGQILELPQLVWKFKGRDLGDAPDSSNHPAAPMSAYAGVPANFPTVRDPATGLPIGPAHVRARPFHLGERVSREREADIGPDADGLNNIDPAANSADRDRFDDGANPNAWSFTDCTSSTVPVRVFIHPVAVAYANNNDVKGHLNIWSDSNRDGDWDDLYDCPGFNTAISEHIVVNHNVDIIALGAGLHTIMVPTNAVPWNAQAEQEAWFRVTLTTKAINLPLAGGGINYSDGRGEAGVYIMGETEDHLRKPQSEDADVYVGKGGQSYQEYDPAGVVTTKVFWNINYGNLGPATATGVQIVDTLTAGQTLVNVTTSPVIPWSQSGNTLTFNVGNLPAGASGSILIETEVVGVPQDNGIQNSVEISADSDLNPSNNTDTASVTYQLHPPTITNPLNGTTCDNVVLIDGVSVPGSTVDVYVDGALLGNYPTDAAGNWGVTTTVADGTHSVYAVAKAGASTSSPSPTVIFIVDSSLPYSPMSLSFTDSSGSTSYAPDSSGRYDGVDPQIILQPNETYTVSVKLCCDDENATVEMDIPGVGNVVLSDADGDDIWTGTFTTGPRGSIPPTSAILLTIICDGSEIIVVGGVRLIDPAGEVYDITDGALQEDATVTLAEKLGGIYSFWPAASFGQLNPQVTAADGWFSFYTPAGTYQLNVEKDGYQDYVSTDIEVIDQLVIYNVPLTPAVAEDADHVVYFDADGFSKAALEIGVGQVVEFVSLAGGRAVSDETDDRAISSFDSGALAPGSSYKVKFDATGEFTYSDSDNPGSIAFITVSTTAPTAVQMLQPVSGSASAITVLASLLALAMLSGVAIVRKRD